MRYCQLSVVVGLALWLITHLFTLAQLCSQQPPPSIGKVQKPESRILLEATSLPGTDLLTEEGDLADTMLTGIDTFLLQQIDSAREGRELIWHELTDQIQNQRSVGNVRVPSQLDDWLSKRRLELSHCIGLRDERIRPVELEILQTPHQSGILGYGEFLIGTGSQADPSQPNSGDARRGWQAFAVRWPVLEGVTAEGILIEPIGIAITSSVVVVPDADQTPEQMIGLAGGLAESSQIGRILASSGCRVLIPTLIDRSINARGPPGDPGKAELTSREFVYRPAFELGRHVIGYEVHKVLSAVDWLVQSTHESKLRTANAKSADNQSERETDRTSELPLIAVAGYGEGGGIALLCGALDNRIDVTYIKGAFGPRDSMWREPICRNLFGFLNTFGDAELAALVWPRTLIVDFAPGPQVTVRSRSGAPGELTPTPTLIAAEEFARTARILGNDLQAVDQYPQEPKGALLSGPFPTCQARWLFAQEYPIKSEQAEIQNYPASKPELPKPFSELFNVTKLPGVQATIQYDPIRTDKRQSHQVAQLIHHTQIALGESSVHRSNTIQSLDTSSLSNYEKSAEPLRKKFYQEVIGQFEQDFMPLSARTRKIIDRDKWMAYEVVLDVWPNVIASGILMIPKNITKGDRRPVVVCQHGLEGRPMDVIQGDHPAYHDFASRLCERGYVVFAPQNPYIMQDKFRTLQRKANSIGKTLFSVIVPQHQQMLNWLKTLDYVDPARIAFYGLSYGGKSAMRIPAILQDYCLSICSADFNEWIVKNASTTEPFSYVWTGEYEIFEYNLGNTFGYAEMASLICPRPFMVERGHFDAVATDPWVGYEYAKVRNLYQARLGIGAMTEIEWFPGPHTINGKGTFEFLDRHLQFSPR